MSCSSKLNSVRGVLGSKSQSGEKNARTANIRILISHSARSVMVFYIWAFRWLLSFGTLLENSDYQLVDDHVASKPFYGPTHKCLAAVERSVEFEVILLRALHIHNVDCVVVRLSVSFSLVLFVKVLVHGLDKRTENCLSSCVPFEAARYQPFFFDGCFVLRKPCMMELLRTAWFEDLLREENRLNSGSSVHLDRPDVQWLLVQLSKVIFRVYQGPSRSRIVLCP